jgi:DNA polymerase III delta prime subunit
MSKSLLKIHENIFEKLLYFHHVRKIPNIIFHGSSGSGKRTIVNDFINVVYENDAEKIKSFVMYVNCAHGKGIKFIREELKFFAKTHIHSNGGNNFKSVVLLNADKLTIDAQSALRRCIELFNHTTRFFIIVEDKYKLLKPILSRCCEFYIPQPLINKREKGEKGENEDTANLYRYNLNETFKMTDVKTQQTEWLKKYIDKCMSTKVKVDDLIEISTKLYEKGYSGLDLMTLLESNFFKNITENKRFEFLFHLSKIKKEFRNEKIFMLFILNLLFLNPEASLENISFV